MFSNLGAAEILVVLLIVLIFFGPKKIPELAQGLGKGLKKFNEAKEGIESQIKTAMKEPMEAVNAAKKNFESQLADVAAPITELARPISDAPKNIARGLNEAVYPAGTIAQKNLKHGADQPISELLAPSPLAEPNAAEPPAPAPKDELPPIVPEPPTVPKREA